NVNLKKDLHWAYLSRGRDALQRKQWGQAVKDLTEAEKFIAAASGTDEASADWQREWAWTYFSLAQAHGAENRSARAADLLRRGRTKLESLIKTAPEMTVLAMDCVSFYDEEIFVLERSGEATKATAVIEEKERFFAGATDPRLLYEAHLSDLGIGDRAKSAKRSDAALAAYRRGREKIARATELEPRNAGWWRNLSKTHRKIGNLREDLGAAKDARTDYDVAVKAGRHAIELKPNDGENWRALYLAQWWASTVQAGDASSAVVLL